MWAKLCRYSLNYYVKMRHQCTYCNNRRFISIPVPKQP